MVIPVLWSLSSTAALGQVNVAVGVLPVGKSVSTTFDVRINSPLPVGVTQIVQQGSVSSNAPLVLTDDPATAAASDPTVMPLSTHFGPGGAAGIPTLSQWGVLLLAALLLVLGRRRLLAPNRGQHWVWMLTLLGFLLTVTHAGIAQLSPSPVTLTVLPQQDTNANGLVDAGDVLRYRARIANSSAQPQLNVVFTLTLDANTTLLAGTLNTSPIGFDQTVVAALNTAQAITLQGSDADGNALTYQITSPAANGQLSGVAPNLIYTPQAGFTGSDSFSFLVNDGQAPSNEQAVVSITVIADQPPVAVNDVATVNEDSGATAINVLLNDTDVDAGPRLVAAVTQALNGVVAITGGGTGLTYQPNANYCNSPPGTTPDTFTYTLNGGSIGSVSVSVTCVNDAPGVDLNGAAAGIDYAATFTEGTAALIVDALNLSVTDSDNTTLASASVTLTNLLDAGAETLMATAVAGITVTYVAPTLTLSGSDTLTNYQTVLRTLRYNNTSPNPNPTARLISVMVNDGAVNSAPAISTVTIIAINSAPSFSAGPNQSVNEDAGAQSVNPWATAISDGDGGSQVLSFNVTANTNAALFSAGPAISPSGVLTYTPAPNANGSASITITLSDNGSNVSPSFNSSAPQTFTITVNAVDDAPVANAITPPAFNEDTQSIITLSYTDAEADLASACAISAPGSVTVTQACACAAGVCTVGVTGTPNYNGAASFGYTVTANAQTSNTAIAALTINPVNDSPLAAAKSYTAHTNMRIVGLSGLLTGATDADNGVGGCTPTFTVASLTSGVGGTVSNLNAGAGSFDFDPNPGFTGTATASYTVQDNGCPGIATSAAATISITVSGPVIWFVQQGAAGTNDGRLSNPFTSLGSVPAVDNANDQVFVFAGTYANGLALLSGEQLIGQGVTGASFDSLFGIAPPAGTIARPAINGARPVLQNTVTLNTNAVVRGLNITPTGATALTDPAGATTGVTVSEVDVSATAATAVSFDTLSGTVTLGNTSATGGANNVSLSAVSGTVDLGGGALSGATATAFNVSGGTASITYAGTVGAGAGVRSASIASMTGGAVTLSGAVSGTGTGVALTGNTGATINLSGGVNLSTGANAAFTATGGGTVNVCDENPCNPAATGALVNTLTTTTGTALNIANTTIGSNNLEFRSISSNGATNGILLNNTGAGGLKVKGNTSGNCGGSITLNAPGTPHVVGAPVTGDCSGGTIQNSTGDGVSLTNTTGTSLTRMYILNSGINSIDIRTVNGFTLANSYITDSAGTDDGIEMGDFATGTAVNGTISISNSTIGPTPSDNFAVGIGSGSSVWNIDRTVFTGGGNTGFNFEIRNATVTSFLIDNSVMQNQFADGMQMQPASGVSATITSATIQNSTFTGNNIGMDLNHDGTSNVTYKVLNNTFQGLTWQAVNFFTSASAGTGGTMNGRFEGNMIGNAAIFNSGGGMGIRVNVNGGADTTVLLNNNTIRQVPNGRGIEIISRNGTGGTDATLTNNFVNTDFVPTIPNGGFSLSNIFLQSNCLSVCNTLRSNIRNNTVPAGPPNGELVAGQLVLIRTDLSTNQLVDNAPASANAASELASQNTGNTAVSGTVTLIAGPINTPP